MKTLLLVESPAKCGKIEKLLGTGYIALASFGHIRDLEKDNLGIDIENDFKPNYKILSDKSKQIKKIQDTIKTVDRVLLASDEDREGEAIAWHCSIVFKIKIGEKNRICFHEITKSALEQAVANPREIDMAMVNSQQSRRILDRLVGFKLSPLLWKYIAPKLSAGRVQSVALKLLIEQEKEISTFLEKKFYKTIGQFNKKISGTLNYSFESPTEIEHFLEDCKTAHFIIQKIDKQKVEKRPPPPYITSTIQQDASLRYGVSSKKIMGCLQKLYESGMITYHRTDNTNLSTLIQDEIKKYITTTFGKEFLHPRTYKSTIKCAQEAHEAIRPTNIDYSELDQNDTSDPIEKKIYNLIWKRTIASQMSPCVSEMYTITISISNRKEFFVSRAEKILFIGYKKIYEDFVSKDLDLEKDKDLDNIIPDSLVDNIKENDILKYSKITSTEKYKNPPPRYSESSIIKKMEKIGIGRPSTYSNIIETLFERKYAEKKDITGTKKKVHVFLLEKNEVKEKEEEITIGGEKKKIVPTDLGKVTNQFLETHFQDILDYQFTSSLEEKLDSIANNQVEWLSVIREFYQKFEPNIKKLSTKEMISQNNIDKKRFLGHYSFESSNIQVPVYTYIGKYGPLVQLGDIQNNDKKNIQYFKLDEKYSIDTVSIEDIPDIIQFPKNLGKYQKKDVFLKKGTYGLYIQWGKDNFKIIQKYDEKITLDQAIECITFQPEPKKKSDMIQTIDGKYIIKNGPYGHYIDFEKKFYKITSKYDPQKITQEDCIKIIEDHKKYKAKNT
jgi:DNA topoisomerase-1